LLKKKQELINYYEENDKTFYELKTTIDKLKKKINQFKENDNDYIYDLEKQRWKI
jgi:hypothetical protein